MLFVIKHSCYTITFNAIVIVYCSYYLHMVKYCYPNIKFIANITTNKKQCLKLVIYYCVTVIRLIPIYNSIKTMIQYSTNIMSYVTGIKYLYVNSITSYTYIFNIGIYSLLFGKKLSNVTPEHSDFNVTILAI